MQNTMKLVRSSVTALNHETSTPVQDAKHNESTMVIQCEHETSTPVHGATLKMQNTSDYGDQV